MKRINQAEDGPIMSAVLDRRQSPLLRPAYLGLAAIAFILIVVFVVGDLIAPAGRRLARIAGVDPPCYFGVAHSLLFDHDFDLTNELKRIPPEDRMWTGVQPATGRPGSPYAVGYSLLAMPLLAAGTAVDKLTGHPADGYSHFALLFYTEGNVLFVGAGLFALFTLLYHVGLECGITENAAVAIGFFLTVAALFGSNVGYYAFSPMSHASTFLFASLFLVLWWRWRSTVEIKQWALLGLVGGWLSICRWQDILLLGGPILFDLGQLRFRRDSASWIKSRLAYGAAAAACWIPQVLEWKSIYNKYLTVPQGPGFLTFPPHYVLQVLFSTRNGWFAWTPLMLIGLCGLVYAAIRVGPQFWPWLVVLAAEVVVVGGIPPAFCQDESFSARYLTTQVPILLVGMMVLLCRVQRPVRNLLVVVACACCLFTVLSAIQFRLNLVPHDSRLTFAEMFTGKVHLVTALRRARAVRMADQQLRNGAAVAAINTLEAAKNAYGEDRALLSVEVRAYEQVAQKAKAEAASKRLSALAQSSLW